jgi:hypothetical protein
MQDNDIRLVCKKGQKLTVQVSVDDDPLEEESYIGLSGRKTRGQVQGKTALRKGYARVAVRK